MSLWLRWVGVTLFYNCHIEAAGFILLAWKQIRQPLTLSREIHTAVTQWLTMVVTTTQTVVICRTLAALVFTTGSGAIICWTQNCRKDILHRYLVKRRNAVGNRPWHVALSGHGNSHVMIFWYDILILVALWGSMSTENFSCDINDQCYCSRNETLTASMTTNEFRNFLSSQIYSTPSFW